MATVIDTLIIELGLDPSKFEEGQKKIANSWLRGRESVLKGAGDVEKSAGKMTDSLAAVQGKLLGIAALFMGGVGLQQFAERLVRASAETARLAQRLGESGSTISQWGNAGKLAGAGVDEVTSSIKSMTSSIEHFKLTGDSPLIQYFTQMGIQLHKNNGEWKTTIELMREMNKWAQGRDPKQVNQMFQEMGMTPGMVTMLMQTPKAFNENLEKGKKYAASDDDLRKLQELQKHWNETELAMEKVARDFLIYVAPVLQGFADGMKQLLTMGEQNYPKGSLPFAPWAGKGKQTSGSFPWAPWMKSDDKSEADKKNGEWRPLPFNAGKIDRSRFRKELEDNPNLREKVMAIGAGENNDPKANMAVLESMMNRAEMTRTSLAYQARTTGEGGYYAGYDPAALRNTRKRAFYEANLEKVLAGSNVSNYATDNSSGDLARREKATGSFTLQSEYNGETFFSPGYRNAGGGRTRNNYEAWRRSLGQTEAANWKAGTSPIPFLNSPGALAAGNRNSNVSNSNSVSIGSMNINTKATDAYGIAQDLPPSLEDYSKALHFNYGQN